MQFHVFLGSARRRKRFSHFLGLLMKRLARLVGPPGGTGQFDSFWVFWNSGLNLIGQKLVGNLVE